MKKNILTLLVILAVITVSAQVAFVKGEKCNQYFFERHAHNRSGIMQLFQSQILKSATVFSEKLIDITTNSPDNSAIGKTDFEYDGNNRVVKSSNYIFDSYSQQWTGQTQNDYIYDNNGNIKEVIISYINPLMAGFLNDVKNEYIYNNAGVLTQMNIYNRLPNTSEWIVYTRSEYTYNSADILTKEVHFVRNIISGELELSGKMEHLYTDTNVLNETKTFTYEPFSESYFLTNKSDYTLNSEGYITEQIDYETNDEGVLQYSIKVENTFDSHGCIVELNSFSYDLIDNIWKADTKSVSIYDYTVEADKLLIPYYFAGMFKYKQTDLETYVWNDLESSWINVQNSKYNYTDFNSTLTTENIDPNKIEIYPNPAKNNIQVSNISEIVKIDIYELTGKSVISQNIKPNELISLKSLNKGIFVYKIISNKKVFSGKLVVE